jgi:hypothetical protein
MLLGEIVICGNCRIRCNNGSCFLGNGLGVQAAVAVDVVVPVFTTIPVFMMIGNVIVVYDVTGFGIVYFVNVKLLQAVIVVDGSRTVEPVLIDVVTTAIQR